MSAVYLLNQSLHPSSPSITFLFPKFSSLTALGPIQKTEKCGEFRIMQRNIAIHEKPINSIQLSYEQLYVSLS